LTPLLGLIDTSRSADEGKDNMTATNGGPAPQGFARFRDFYPFYLSEHCDRRSRRLHVVGTGLVICTLIAALATGRYLWLWMLPVVGYGFAWAGHFFFEKNRPATFRYPFYSLAGDFVMFKDVLTGRIRW
jgi:hypothetical protein